MKYKACDLPIFRKNELEETIITHVKAKLTDQLIDELAKRTHEELAKEK